MRMNSGTNMRLNNQGASLNDTGEVQVTGATVSAGGNFVNSGKVKVFEGGVLRVEKDLLNSGDILINDPEKIKEIIIEALKTTQNVASFGSKIIEKFFGK